MSAIEDAVDKLSRGFHGAIESLLRQLVDGGITLDRISLLHESGALEQCTTIAVDERPIARVRIEFVEQDDRKIFRVCAEPVVAPGSGW